MLDVALYGEHGVYRQNFSLHEVQAAILSVAERQQTESTDICLTGPEHTTTCTCTPVANREGPPPQSGNAKDTVVQFSAETNKLTLVCKGSSTVAPPTLKSENAVCPETADLSKCKTGGGDPKAAPISTTNFLDGEKVDSIQWTELSASMSGDTTSSYSLTVPSANLPRSDKAFAVGCISQEKPVCKVTVNLPAKRSKTTTRNVVQCAYGAQSNSEGPQQVTLSQTETTLTLICGKEGTVQPENYLTSFCTDNDMKHCTNAYTEVLPDFKKEWWTPSSTSETNEYMLQVPQDLFPEQDKKIVVGCKHKDESESSPASSKHSRCSVSITLKGTGSASTSTAYSQRNMFITFFVVVSSLAALRPLLQ
ncbi:SAG-related sequence [Besnoitia besnoiti]|uniref:SAG-related sequence n=1 Tax=Besnoitia besnoiti TaxID=94643 RepID=A0A2A9M8Q6_BESBE|nr:SAG-related sequence [Besnoitia besnoiti]PFH33554.1 SAG-related sequence [Besnoitia besnoiti]